MFWALQCLNCRRQAERYLCPACWRQVLSAPDPFKEFETPAYSLYVYGLYQGLLKSLLYQLKYHGRRKLGGALGYYLGQWFLTHKVNFDWVIPVPLHVHRRKERGYNQAQLLAKGIAQVSGKPLRIVLKRSVSTPPLFNQSPTERQHSLRGAFTLDKPIPQRIQSILLVDDIYTTGSTLQELVTLLHQEHEELTITALTLAQSVKDDGVVEA